MSELFRPCILIPTYDNPKTLGDVVHEALEYVASVIIVNDGSGPEGSAAVEALRTRAGVDVVRRLENGGKGAAVKDGLARAAQLGFSHALQVDADGQHTLHDVPRFLAAARGAPHALVLGAPVFDASAPKARLWARKITTFWCSVETGGRSIADAMCGFRVYPVGIALAAKARGNRMDFDPEIAVRLAWSGTQVINLRTQVRYLTVQEGGISHFQLLRDNWRISVMHTRLVCGAVLRACRKLFGKPQLSPAWHQIPEAGNAWGIRFLAGLCRRFGRAPARLLLPFIVAYFMLSRGSARSSSKTYLRRLGVSSSPWAVYKHLLRFAECALDRFFLLAGDVDRFEITHHGHEHLTALAQEKRGAILLGAHVGSFEALRVLADRARVSVFTLGYFDNAAMLNRELDRTGANRQERFVRVVPGELQHVLRIKELIERGHFVALLGDRSTGEKGIAVEFLGATAILPSGPYALAAALQCPILLTLGLHYSPNRYELHCEPFLNRVPKRHEKPQVFLDCAQAFARRLEHYCRRAPDNWFNFYDFWAADTRSAALRRRDVEQAPRPQ